MCMGTCAWGFVNGTSTFVSLYPLPTFVWYSPVGTVCACDNPQLEEQLIRWADILGLPQATGGRRIRQQGRKAPLQSSRSLSHQLHNKCLNTSHTHRFSYHHRTLPARIPLHSAVVEFDVPCLFSSFFALCEKKKRWIYLSYGVYGWRMLSPFYWTCVFFRTCENHVFSVPTYNFEC